MWLAAKVQGTGTSHCDSLPWSSVEELYNTIDNIQVGAAPFETVEFKYNGPLPSTPPAWMTQTYKLSVRDSRTVLHHQLATSAFATQFNMRPYQQFQVSSRDRVWSNLLSGDWAWDEAVSNEVEVCCISTHPYTFFCYRPKSRRTPTRMEPCLCLLSQGWTRRQYRWQQVIKNSIRSTSRPET